MMQTVTIDDIDTQEGNPIDVENETGDLGKEERHIPFVVLDGRVQVDDVVVRREMPDHRARAVFVVHTSEDKGLAEMYFDNCIKYSEYSVTHKPIKKVEI